MSEILKTCTVIPEHKIPDSHFYFRGHFSIPADEKVKIKLTGASWFEAWMDEKPLTTGPARFNLKHPEYEEIEIDLCAGEHLLALHLHYDGVETRLAQASAPVFIFASVSAGGKEIPVEWVYLPLDAYRRTGRRIDCILGWIEWCRTDKLPQNWKAVSFHSSTWFAAEIAEMFVESFQPLNIGKIKNIIHHPAETGAGALVNMSVFSHDPTAAFISRRLSTDGFPAQGIWRRFDLGKVRLGRMIVSVTAPAGTVVQVAYAEFLHNGRVSPYISSSAGDVQSCNLDHFVLCGGKQTVMSLHPRGGRFVEVHIICDTPAKIEIEKIVFEERVYYAADADGLFSCSDSLLNQIWTVGVETLRSCSEDAITDNPSRERGQWLGDAVGAGMDMLAVSYADMRPLKRGLIQAVQCTGADGLIPAVFPGTISYLPSYSIQWVSALAHYYELTGDIEILKQLYPAAVADIRSFDSCLSDDGLRMNPAHWNFIDWGYRGSSTGFRDEDEHYIEMDLALSLFYLKALQSLIRWAGWIGLNADMKQWKEEEVVFRKKMLRFFEHVDGNPADWAKLGYHASALALGSGLLEAAKTRAACCSYIKQHILSCFPNCADAPRLYDTTVEDSRLITPFFFHHVFPALIDAGEIDFVLEQFRVCWGWMIDEGFTTWLEVFDKRWSHCHQWSGCPTWILSRYSLGLHPRFDLGMNHYDLKLCAGDLSHAGGIIPVPYTKEQLNIQWKKNASGIDWTLKTSAPVWLHINGDETPVKAESGFSIQLPAA